MTKTFRQGMQSVGAAAVLALALSAPAGALTLSTALEPGVLNTIEDQDREAYIDNGDGVLGVGDVFIGFVRLDNVLPTGGPTGDTVYGVISNQITAINVGGDSTIFSLGTTTVAGLTLQDLTGDASTAGGMFAIYDGIAPSDLIANEIGATDIFDYINYITTGNLEVVAGIDSADNYLMVDNGILFPAGTSNSQFPGLTASFTTGSFTGGLDALVNNTGFNFTDSVQTVDALGTLHTTPIGIRNGAVSGASGDGHEDAFTNAPGFTQCTVGGDNVICGFITKADFLVAPTAVPEPGSLALLGGALLGFLGIRRKILK